MVRLGMRLALRRAAALAAALALALAPAAAAGQASEEEAEAAAAEAAATAESLSTIENILGAIAEKNAAADLLRDAIEAAETDVDKATVSEELSALKTEIDELDRQVNAIATGVADDAGASNGAETFDLQAELEQLAQPFIWAIKSATENARAIQTLERAQLSAARAADAAEKALKSLTPLLTAAEPESAVAARLKAAEAVWSERRDAARDRERAAARQLEARRSARTDPRETAGEAFQAFFSERGRNLVFGVGAFAAVFFALRLARRGALAAIGAPRNRSVPARLGAFIFDGVTVMAAFGAMLAVFNLFSDWLLTGLTVLLLLALGWFLLRSAPALFEQVTLLLNLGAVQEGERVMLDGVPWRVKRLDFYSELENPALRGGSFTVPIRQLLGLHSRPMDAREVWFPSVEGDWVELSGGLWGQVVFQSPELVQIRDEGGAVTTFTLPAYLEQSPRNLSGGFQVESVIGLDYAHQAEAPDRIPEALRAYVAERLGAALPDGSVRSIEAGLINAGDSALDIEVTARMTGAAAPRLEDVRDALARLAVECCTRNGWSIPYPTMTLKR